MFIFRWIVWTQSIAWKVVVQMTYRNLLMYRKCFMHCDILIYSYSSVSISQCNFGDSPRANFLFTEFIVQFAFCCCYWCCCCCSFISFRFYTLCHVIRSQNVSNALGYVQTLPHHHFYHKYAQAVCIERFGMQYKKRTFRWMMLAFDFEHKIERVQPWRFNSCIVFSFGMVR